jgi:hypothetical protein
MVASTLRYGALGSQIRHLHLEVDAKRFVDEPFLLYVDYTAKSGMLGGHLVVANKEPRYLEKSLFVCACNVRGLGSRVGHSNSHAGDHRTQLVVDCSVNSPSCILSRRQGWRYNHKQREQQHPRKFHGDLRIQTFRTYNSAAQTVTQNEGSGDGHFPGYQLSYAPPSVSVSTRFSQRLSAPPVGR